MNILVDINHPAHVHLFRNAMRLWLDRGHQVAITIRDKDLTATLLDRYGFSYVRASAVRRGTLGLAVELVEHDWNVLKVAKRHRSQFLLGTSVSISHVARLIGAQAIVFNEDDAEVARAFTQLAYPLAHCIVTPTCLNENHGSRHVSYHSYEELAYLHPNVFTPDPDVLIRLGMQPDEPYYIIRLVSLRAVHDKGETGLSSGMTQRLIQCLSQYGGVFLTSESPLPEELESYRMDISPTDMHDALSYATLFVGDSQSMAVESAMLGTPAIRCNTFARRCSVLQELEHRYGLTYAFLPEEEALMFAKIGELLSKGDLSEEWRARRASMLAERIDLTAWMVDFVERYPHSMLEHQGRRND